jgi:Bacterial type II and III secretion system protein
VKSDVRPFRVVLVAAVVLSIAMTGIRAQSQATTKAEVPAAAVQLPLKITVVISRFKGEQKTASLPYTLSVNANGRDQSTLRMGADVPVPVQTMAQSGQTNQSYQYRSIGTNIDCTASPTDDGRFRVVLAVQDSQVFSDATGGTAPGLRGMPSFQQFTSETTVVLRDGQTIQYTTATDKASGEVVKIDVTLNVIK